MIAAEEPTRGLVASNRSGIAQLYAWDVPTSTLTQVTDCPQGQLFGTLSPDGRYVYYHDEKEGKEVGHFVRLPFEGGAPEDITPRCHHMPLLACDSAVQGISSVYGRNV